METNDLSFFKPSILNRNISKSQINKLKKSIQNFGQQDEIKIKPDGTIIDGHHRYYAGLAFELMVKNMIRSSNN